MSWATRILSGMGEGRGEEGRGVSPFINSQSLLSREGDPRREGGLTSPGVSLGPSWFLYSESETRLDSTHRSISYVISSVL